MEDNRIEYYAANATLLTIPTGDVKVKGIIIFVHGMCERKERYTHVMDYFSRNGYICAASDLRGHGERADAIGQLGYFGKSGDKAFVKDLHKSILQLKNDFPNLPLILIGHSMGSLIVRAYAKKYDNEVDILVVCGCPSNNTAAGIGKLLIKSMALVKGWQYKSEFIKKLVSGGYNKSFASEGSDNAWLSTDKTISEKYNSDKLCGFTFTLNGYYCLLSLITTVYSRKGWRMANAELPIHFISGGDDPCRVSDKKFLEAVSHMKNVGYINVSSFLYPGRRHELFNESNQSEIFDDILQFIVRVQNS